MLSPARRSPAPTGASGAQHTGGTLTGLAIVFDEGPASVLLDNLIVTTQTTEGRWYGPGPA